MQEKWMGLGGRVAWLRWVSQREPFVGPYREVQNGDGGEEPRASPPPPLPHPPELRSELRAANRTPGSGLRQHNGPGAGVRLAAPPALNPLIHHPGPCPRCTLTPHVLHVHCVQAPEWAPGRWTNCGPLHRSSRKCLPVRNRQTSFRRAPRVPLRNAPAPGGVVICLLSAFVVSLSFVHGSSPPAPIASSPLPTAHAYHILAPGVAACLAFPAWLWGEDA